MFATLKEELNKRFGAQVEVVYVDVDDAVPEEAEEMAVRLQMEERWLPVVAVGDEILCEGVLKLADVGRALKRHGVR